MTTDTIRIIMNGVSGRMGYRQHLVRSILAIRDQGGVDAAPTATGSGRADPRRPHASKLAELAAKHGIEDYTTDLDAALADPRWEIYADFLVTKARPRRSARRSRRASTIYTEKPTAETVEEALELATLARGGRASRPASCTTSSTCRACRSSSASSTPASSAASSRCAASSATGSSRATGSPRSGRAGTTAPRTAAASSSTCSRTGTTCSRTSSAGSSRSTPRPSTHIPDPLGRDTASPYAATAEDAAYGIFELEGGIVAQINSSWTVRVNRDELVEFHVDGTHGSAVVRPVRLPKIQPRNATPSRSGTPTSPTTTTTSRLGGVPDNDVFQNGFRAAVGGVPHPTSTRGTEHEFDLLSGARGVLLAEAGLQSSAARAQGRAATLTLE